MTLNAMLALHCVSRSIAKTRHFLMTSAPARFIMVVVLPTPPLLFAIQMIRPGRRAGGEISVIFAVFLAAISTYPRGVELSSLSMISPPQVNYQVFSPVHTPPSNGGGWCSKSGDRPRLMSHWASSCQCPAERGGS